MSYPFNYPTPTNANIQIFYEPAPTNANGTWVKPQGASFVWFTLIGAGGAGGDTFGGGSGAVTNCMVPAFLMPDQLNIQIGAGGNTTSSSADGGSTIVYYKTKTSNYSLLTANGGLNGAGPSGGSGATASTSNYFSCMGFYQSIAGAPGSTGVTSASTTTFLSGGGGASGVTANYGYSYTGNGTGFFQLQPIIVGLGSTSNASKNSGIGCGGGVSTGAGSYTNGGNGLCVIITW